MSIVVSLSNINDDDVVEASSFTFDISVVGAEAEYAGLFLWEDGQSKPSTSTSANQETSSLWQLDEILSDNKTYHVQAEANEPDSDPVESAEVTFTTDFSNGGEP